MHNRSNRVDYVFVGFDLPIYVDVTMNAETLGLFIAQNLPSIIKRIDVDVDGITTVHDASYVDFTFRIQAEAITELAQAIIENLSPVKTTEMCSQLKIPIDGTSIACLLTTEDND